MRSCLIGALAFGNKSSSMRHRERTNSGQLTQALLIINNAISTILRIEINDIIDELG